LADRPYNGSVLVSGSSPAVSAVAGADRLAVTSGGPGFVIKIRGVWSRWAAQFAGDDVTHSVVEPEARSVLLTFDRTATHRSVLVCPD
jgi:hypothetical protein